MSTEISRFVDVSNVGCDFDTGTMCGSKDVGDRNGTPKLFTINTLPATENGMVVMPKFQALLVAGQIAHQYGYKLEKADV